MKRVLLATTALGMSAGVAFAQDMGMADDGMMMEPATSVTLSGDGRMGIISTKADELKFSSRIRIKVSASATLDNGLSAGGSVRTEQDGTEGKAGSIFLAGPFGTLTMGDVDAAAKAAIGNVPGVGYVNQQDPSDISYLRGGGGDDPTLQYALPKMGPVQVYASVGMAEETEDGVTKTEISADTLSIGAKADLNIADMGSAWIGGGFEATTEDDEDGHLVFGAGAEVSGFTGKVVFGMQGRDDTATDDDRDRDQFAVSAGYSAGQMGVSVFYTDDSEFEGKDGHEALGAGFSWKLGGGAELKAGFTNWPADDDITDDEDEQTADLGVTFAF